MSLAPPHHLKNDHQLANIIFNETRSLSGPGIAQARVNIVHAIINAEYSPHAIPEMAPSTAHVPRQEIGIYSSCLAAVLTAHSDIQDGHDPTNGATHFNFRVGPSTASFFNLQLQTQAGPLKNSNPRPPLNSKDNIYANTYK